MEQEIENKVMDILMKYCNPKAEFDGVPPKQIAQEIIKAVRGY
jgi:hypothetical protein